MAISHAFGKAKVTARGGISPAGTNEARVNHTRNYPHFSHNVQYLAWLGK